MIFPWHSHLVLVAAMFFWGAPQVCQSWLSKLKQQRLGPWYPLHIPTVDGWEILHQLMVYPIILFGFQPSFWWCRISQPSTVLRMVVMIFVIVNSPCACILYCNILLIFILCCMSYFAEWHINRCHHQSDRFTNNDKVHYDITDSDSSKQMCCLTCAHSWFTWFNEKPSTVCC